MIAKAGMEEHYKTMLEQIAVVTVMASFDAVGAEQTVYVSPQIEQLLGYSQKEWLANSSLWYASLHPEDKARFEDEFARTVMSGVAVHSVYRFLHKDGRTVWVLGDARIQRDPATTLPIYVLATGVDVTALKITETPKELT
jgi:PAS domain S-box-containing protein